MIDHVAQRLSQTEIFNKFPSAVRVDLARLATVGKLAPGEFCCHQGDLWPYVIFLIDGAMQWTMLSIGGREHVLFMLSPDELFWGHSIFDDHPMPASLMATQSSITYRWHRDVIIPFLYRYPETLWELAGVLTGTMRKAREIIYGLAFQPVAARLATLLLDRFSDPGNTSVERDLTLSAIASRVASSPEVVCRVLQQFQSEGVLEVTRATITLFDREALEGLVETS
ncbi:MAG: Crp/Fnr family transcriptional regulator [Anaerolineales bacterium]|nr:Crp/Fnr family transcriptional regulator [Anaerolineales bacterium]